MEKVRPWCGQPSDRGRLKNRNRYGPTRVVPDKGPLNGCVCVCATTRPQPTVTLAVCRFAESRDRVI